MASWISLPRNRVRLLNDRLVNTVVKRFALSVMLILAVSAGMSAQTLKGLLGKVAGEVSSSGSGNTVANVLSALLGSSKSLTDEALWGTWSYEGVACILESESALLDMGGSAVTSALEKKIDGAFAKIGVSKGKCSFSFAKGGSCSINVDGFELKGNYQLNAAKKMIVFTFVYDKVPMNTYVAYEAQNLNIVFEADRLLEFIKNVATSVSKNVSAQQQGQLSAAIQTAGTIGALLQDYDGLMLGAELAKTNVGSATVEDSSGSSSSSSTGEKVLKGIGKMLK